MSFAAIAAGATIVGTALSISGSRKASRAAKEAAEQQRRAFKFEAAQLEQQADLAIGSGQRAMLEERRRAKLVESRALAVAAASGAGASDVTVVNKISQIAAEGAYRSAVALYEGRERARVLGMAAKGRRLGGQAVVDEGNLRAQAYGIQGLGSLFQGVTSLYDIYSRSQR